MPENAIQISTNAQISARLNAMLDSFESAAQQNVQAYMDATGNNAFTITEKRALVKLEQLKLIGDLTLAEVMLRGEVIRQIENEARQEGDKRAEQDRTARVPRGDDDLELRRPRLEPARRAQAVPGVEHMAELADDGTASLGRRHSVQAGYQKRVAEELAQATERIAKAQASRGAEWGTRKGGLLARTRQLIPLIVPLFMTSLQRAETMALAMDARAYGSKPQRGSMVVLTFDWPDAVAVLLAAATCAAILMIG